MEKGHNIDAPAMMRRKRKVARQQREKTPEPTLKIGAKISDEESSSAIEQGIQTVKMQIRPPGSVSAHKSKILSRRNKSFTGAAVRSSSAPREREPEVVAGGMTATGTGNGCDPHEVMHLLRYARRSLSSPRHKEESSESGKSSPPYQMAPPPPPIRMQRPVELHHSTDDERLSRLERNFQRFEQERRKFEIEKLLFEREKRELHRMRYRHLEREDRRRLVESYRKFNDKFSFPSDSDEKYNRLSDSSREPRSHHEPKYSPPRRKQPQSRAPDYESSTASSVEESSDAFQADFDDEEVFSNDTSPVLISPEQRNRSLSRHSSSNSPARKQITEKSREPSIETVRERKKSMSIEKPVTDQPSSEAASLKKEEKLEQRKGFYSKLLSIFSIRKKIPIKKEEEKSIMPDDVAIEKDKPVEKLLSIAFIRLAWREFRREWINIKADYPEEVLRIRVLWRKCFSHIIILALFCGFGGLIFRFVEGSWENSYKCGVRKVKRDFIDHLWQTSHNLREDDWKSAARNKLRQFEEELQTAFEAGMTSYSETKAWSFVNSVMFCLTVVTSIGYGHIAPKTTLGRGITIIYAIIGIPMFLILLADFGKLFTRMMKFVWAYVRRVYYTGTCRKVRKQQQVQDVMRGINTVYDYAIRRPSAYITQDVEAAGGNGDESQQQRDQTTKPPDTPQSVIGTGQTNTETPTTPYPETFEIDDEFNLPISVATTILLIYIFAGALVYVMWEDWSYFESFYFVFISMSTIGFGDFVPNHPIFMMCSIIYLIFGLALTSMFINVVQIKLSDSFKQASAKIGATIGLVAEGECTPSIQNPNTPGGEEITAASIKLENILEGRENENQSTNHTSSNANYNNKNHTSSNNNNHSNTLHVNNENSPPPLLPKKSSIAPPTAETEKKSKKRFF